MLTLSRGGPDVLDEPAGRRKDRRDGQRLGRGVQPQRRRRLPGDRVATACPRARLHVPRQGPHHRHARRRLSGKRGGIHNSLTRLLIKPTHLIGGYAQLSFGFNYYGPTGNQRDEVTVIRRRSQEVSTDEGHGPDGDGHEPRQVHRLPHLLGHLQAGLDQPARRRVRVVQQRGDPPGPRLPAHLRGPGPLAGRLGARPAGPAAAAWPAGRATKLLRIFANPELPSIDDYYEPWTYDYDTLITAPAAEHVPVARPISLIDGRPMKIQWSANWDDDLGRAPEPRAGDPILQKLDDKVRLDYERRFMFYLPRICEHCLNPSCVGVVPSGAMYKRAEDGIVLVDQDRCRGWRMCVSGCPYKKVYFNHRTGKAEKCTFCYPRDRGRPADGLLGDLRRAAPLHRPVPLRRGPGARGRIGATSRPARSTALHIAGSPRPSGAHCRAEKGYPRRLAGGGHSRSPVYALACRYRVALPLHPEYRTMPMVWYIPPLSPVVESLRDTGFDGEDNENLFAAIEALRIPVEYLAELFTAGDPYPVKGVLRTLAAMRSHMRRRQSGRGGRPVDRRGRRHDL